MNMITMKMSLAVVAVGVGLVGVCESTDRQTDRQVSLYAQNTCDAAHRPSPLEKIIRGVGTIVCGCKVSQDTRFALGSYNPHLPKSVIFNQLLRSSAPWVCAAVLINVMVGRIFKKPTDPGANSRF